MNKQDTVAEQPCPYCGSEGRQEWIAVPLDSAQVAGIAPCHYLPGMIRCTNDECPGP